MREDMHQLLNELEERIDVTFTNRDLLIESLTHRSYINEHNDRARHNENLEFLGDAALGLVVGEYLFARFRDKATEGTLTRFRSALVNADRIAECGKALQLDQLVLLSRSQARMEQDSREWRYLVGCAFEALLGAILLDQGIGSVRMVIDHVLLKRASQIISEYEDSKSELQELAQARWRVTPRYQVIDQTGPDHRVTFRVGVYIDSVYLAEGADGSKIDAEKAAAKTAIQTIHIWEGRLDKRS